MGVSTPEFIFRDFGGMDVLAAREAINDDDFYWCENAIPLAPGNLVPTTAPSNALLTVGTESGSPSYTMTFNVAGTDYSFAVWKNTGHGYVVNLSTFIATQIITGLFSGQTQATQYNNQGLLIIDPTGYWDWNVTAPGVLTPQNNSASGTTLVLAGPINGGTSLRQVVTTAAGTGASFLTQYQVQSATLNAAGTGYAVGDVISLTDGSPTTPCQITVTTIGGGGAITGITMTTPGVYPGPPSSTLVSVGPAGSTSTTTGGGSGATFKILIIAFACNVLTRGTGYANTDNVVDQFFAVTFHTIDLFNINSSGVIGGIDITTYAGRVWIANNRSVFFTDINSYNSFGGAGGFFVINDSYLHNNITGLFAANNYLYIFGDSCTDVLSNVQVVAGVTQFSRINVQTSVGTVQPTSLFGYYRAVGFFHPTGLYLLSGATPEKISEKISGIVTNILTTQPVYCCQVAVQGELCACMLFTFTDVFTQGGAQRALFALFFRGKWWVASFPALNPQAMFSVPVKGVSTIFAWSGNQLFQAFSAAAGLNTWLVKTKLYSGNAVLHEKQALNAAFGAGLAGAAGGSTTYQVDTEFGSSTPIPFTNSGTLSGNQLFVQPANANSGNNPPQYLGLTVAGGKNTARVALLALRGQTDRNMLAS